jgi:endonuclease/exonuclease/phosphatase (EEP) superfamily protein YafD
VTDVSVTDVSVTDVSVTDVSVTDVSVTDVSVTDVSVTDVSVTNGAPHTEIVTELDGATLTLIGVNAEIPASSQEADARLEYFAAVAARAAEVETRVAVVGNLSTTRWSHAFRVLAGDPPLRSSEDGNGYAATWSIYPSLGVTATQHLLGLPIDHVLMSEDLTATAHTVGPDLGPNHRGVVVDLARAGA